MKSPGLLLRRRNLVLVASLRESILAEAAARPIHDLRDALRVASAHSYVAARARAHEKLRGRGFLALDVEPEELPTKVANRHLEIKRGRMLPAEGGAAFTAFGARPPDSPGR